MYRYSESQRAMNIGGGNEGRSRDVSDLPGRSAPERTPKRVRNLDQRSRDAGLPKRHLERIDALSLDQAELRALSPIGKFGTIRVVDLLSRPKVKDQGSSWSRILDRLRELELISIHTLQNSLVREQERPKEAQQTQRVAVLTSRGVDALRAAGYDEEKEGRLHAGLQKGREAMHDCRIFEIALREMLNLKSAGCTDYRVFTDSQLKALVLKREQELHSRGEPNTKAQAAQSYGVPVLDQSYVFPDMRIEYTDKGGKRRGINIELYTHHYSKRQRQIKQDAGLKGWDLDDGGHIMEQVFSR